MRMRRPGSRLTMRKMGLCRRSVFQTGRELTYQQRTRVAVDCSLEHHMTHKRELESLVKQIKLACIANLRAPRPFQLYLTGLGTGSRIHNALNTHISDFHKYQIEVMEGRHDSIFDPQDIVYLTSDATTDLEGIDSCKVYVIGGIVDLTINKRLTLHRARLAGLSTARLPIATYMESTTPSPHNIDLPLNIVTDILLDVHSGKGWPSALHAHLPKRKGFRLKSGLAISESDTSRSSNGTKCSCKV